MQIGYNSQRKRLRAEPRRVTKAECLLFFSRRAESAVSGYRRGVTHMEGPSPTRDARPSLGVWMVWGSHYPGMSDRQPTWWTCFLSPDPSRRDPEPPP